MVVLHITWCTIWLHKTIHHIFHHIFLRWLQGQDNMGYQQLKTVSCRWCGILLYRNQLFSRWGYCNRWLRALTTCQLGCFKVWDRDGQHSVCACNKLLKGFAWWVVQLGNHWGLCFIWCNGINLHLHIATLWQHIAVSIRRFSTVLWGLGGRVWVELISRQWVWFWYWMIWVLFKI